MTTVGSLKKIAIFEIIATGLCGLGALYIYKNKISFKSAVGVGILTTTMYAPTISVFITQKLIYGDKGSIWKQFKNVPALNKANGINCIKSWLIPVFLNVLAIPLSAYMFKDIQLTTDLSNLKKMIQDKNPANWETEFEKLKKLKIHPFWLGIISSFVGGLLNSLFAFGEECGWRGFLYKELRHQYGFWTYSLVSGVLWGLWHSPLILIGYNYPKNSRKGVLYMTTMCTLISPYMTYIMDVTHNVWFPSLFHGSFNASAGLPMIVLNGGNEFVKPPTGMSSFILNAIGLIPLYFVKKYNT